MKKNVYILFFLLFAFVIKPIQVSATPLQNEVKECCIAMEKSCHCSSDESHTSKMSCKGHCESINCTNHVTFCFSDLLTNEDILPLIFSNSKGLFFYTESLIPSDYNFIWQPPKIA